MTLSKMSPQVTGSPAIFPYSVEREVDISTDHVYGKCVCIRTWSLPIGPFQDHCKQTVINVQINITRLRDPTGGR